MSYAPKVTLSNPLPKKATFSADTGDMGIFSRIAHTVSGGDFRMNIKDPHQIDDGADRIVALVEASNHSEQAIVLASEARYELSAVYRDNNRSHSNNSSREHSKGPVKISELPISIEPGETIKFSAEIIFAKSASVSDLIAEQTEQLPELMRTVMGLAGKLGEMASHPDSYNLKITVFLENGEKLESDSKSIRCGSGMNMRIGPLDIDL